jgi:hypothetical protein
VAPASETFTVLAEHLKSYCNIQSLTVVRYTDRINGPAKPVPRWHWKPQSGRTAVTSISTLARSSTSALTSTQVMAGKLRPMTSR